MKRVFRFCANTAQTMTKMTLVQKFMRDLGSLRALWNYFFLGLYVWIAVYGVIHYGKDCIATAITTTGTLVGWIFLNYVFFGHMDKRLGNLTPMIGTTGWTGDIPGSQGNSENPIVAPEVPKLVDGSAVGGGQNG